MVTKLWYDMELSRLLSDEHYYEKVDNLPFSKMKLKLVTILKRYGGTIGEKVMSYILHLTENNTPAHFKIYPKVHKNPLVGRPIVVEVI